MSNSNESQTGGSVPVGRIAGVAVLAGGLIALTVVAMNHQSREIEPTTPQTQQVANQTSAEAQQEEPSLVQADLSKAEQPTISPELTQRLISRDATVAHDANQELLAQQDEEQTPEERTRQTILAQKEAAQGNTNDQVRNTKINPTQSSVEANPNASITFESLVYDFGDIYSKNPIEGRFAFTSTGTEPLIVDRVQTTCGCTSANAAELRNSSWDPGTGAAIEFTFTPSAVAGEQRKVIRVYTNSENHRTISLEFKANYIPSVKLSSQTANFGRIEAGKIGQSRIVIESRDPNFKFENFDLGDSADQFTWSYTKLEAVNEQFPSRGQLLVQTKPDAMIGPMSRVIGIIHAVATEGDAEEPSPLEYNVVMRGEIVGQIEVEPRIARAPLAELGSAFEHTFTVSSPKGQAFKISEIKLAEGEIENFEFEVAPVEASQSTSYRVTVSGKAPNRAGGYMGQVLIYTDIENHGPMTFQFTGVTRAARP